MRYSTLTNLGQVSTVALGAWQFAGGSWGPVEDTESIRTVDAALDAGINLIDTAEKYGKGRSEEVIGKALQGKREKAVIATKVAQTNLTRAEVIAACEGSLQRLQTDYIDLYQVHWPNPEVEAAETAAGLEKLLQDGKIRAAGVCNYGPVDLTTLMNEMPLVSNQMCYSLFFRAVEHEVLPLCQKAGVGILCYSPLMMGLLSGKYHTLDEFAEATGRAKSRVFSAERGAKHGGPGCEPEAAEALTRIHQICNEIGEAMPVVALAWLLHQPGVTAVLAGSRTPEQVQDNARTAGLRLPEDVVQALTEATEPVKQKLGRSLEPNRSEEDSRIH